MLLISFCPKTASAAAWAVYKCLSDSSYFHYRFKQVFLTAGFEVRHVERNDCHPVWQVKLVRGACVLSRQSVEAARQIVRLLKSNGRL